MIASPPPALHIRMPHDLSSASLPQSHFPFPGSSTFVFLLSVRAGGVGLNLQSADTVVMVGQGIGVAEPCLVNLGGHIGSPLHCMSRSTSRCRMAAPLMPAKAPFVTAV